MHTSKLLCGFLVMLLLGSAAASAAPAKPVILRVGYFPNITHAQALVARQLSRQGKGWFEQRLGPNVEIRWFTYNAGPSAMEAILANSLDISYVGPNPALNAYIRSRGKAVRLVSGAARGGAALVLQKNLTPKDLRGKKIATPQFGNTQDVACRVWLEKQGFKVTMTGGDVHVLPTPNPDQLPLFQRGTVAGVWTVEPWVSRLELEAGGNIFLLEDDAVTTLLVARSGFLTEQPALAKQLIDAHKELTAWIKAHDAEAQEMARSELSETMKREFPKAVFERAWSRIHLNIEIPLEALEQVVMNAKKTGFLKSTLPIKDFVYKP